MQQLLHRCFKTLIVCPSLLVANTTLLAFKTLLFLFFPKSALPNWECGLSMDAAYTWTFTVIISDIKQIRRERELKKRERDLVYAK